MNKRTLLTLFLILGCVQASFAQRLTLTDSVREVLGSNPQILEKLKNYNASVAESQRSEAGFYPSVDILAETGYQDVKNSTTAFEYEDDWISGAGVTVRQNIIDGGYTSNDVKAKSALAKARLFDYCAEANRLAFQSIEAYVNVLKNDRLEGLAAEHVRIHQQILNSVQSRVQAGTGGSASVARVQGRLARAQSKFLLRQNEYKKSVYNFHQFLGRYTAAAELELPQFDATLLPMDLKEAFVRQYHDHPAIIAADFDVESQRFQHKRDKSSYYPKVDLEASQWWSQDYDGIEGDENDMRILLKLRYNLYDGGDKSALAQKNISLINLLPYC